MVTTLPPPDPGRHRTDERPGARAPHRSGRGRHVAAPDHARRRRIIGLGAVTVAAAAVLPVVTGPQLADVTSRAWEGLSGSRDSGAAAPGSAPAGGTTGALEPSPGTGAHRAEEPAPPGDAAREPVARPTAEPSAQPTAPPAPPPDPPEPPDVRGEPTATYRVVWGDTLSTIGADHGMTWRQVHDANADVIGPNPNLVVVGTVLRVRAA